MSFLYPNFFWALLVLIIPIVIHFLNLQRTKKILFTNFQYLKRLENETKRNFQLRNVLVLIARLLFIFFLVVAFTQPYFGSKPQLLKKNDNNYFFIDNSLSTLIKTDEVNRFSLIKKVAYNLISAKNDNSKFCFNRGKGSLSKSNSIKYLNSLKISSKKNENGYLSKMLLFNEKESESIENIYVISDFQKINQDLISDIRSDTLHKYTLIPISDNKEVNNYYIDSVWLNSPFIHEIDNNTIYIRLNRIGEVDKKSVIIDLYIDDQIVGSKNVNGAFNGSDIFPINFRGGINELMKCKVSIRNDHVDYDNDFYFVLESKKNFNILIINDNSFSFVENALKNEPRFNLTTSTTSKIGDFEIEDYDVFFVENLKVSDSQIKSILEKQLQLGKVVMMFPEEGGYPENYQRYLDQLNIKCRIYNRKSGIIDNNDYLKAPSYYDPLFSNVFTRLDNNVEMPYLKSSIQITDNNLGVLLSNKMNMAGLMKAEIGNGILYFWSTPLDEKFTNLSNHSIFLPIMYQTILSNGSNNGKTYYSLDRKVLKVMNPNHSAQNIWSLQKENKKIINSQKGKEHIYFDLKDAEIDNGYYNLTNNDSIYSAIAINNSNNESDTRFYTQGGLESYFGSQKNVSIIHANSVISAPETLTPNWERDALWKKSLILSLIFLLIEIVLIRLLK